MRRTAFYGTVMSGGKDHGLLAGATRVARTTTAPAYRLWTNAGRYPLLQRDEAAAGAIRCEVWDVPDEVYARIHASEPPGLVPGTIELVDGTEVAAFVADPAFVATTPLLDVTEHGGFLAYLAQSEKQSG
jgi:allophanate hydrolase